MFWKMLERFRTFSKKLEKRQQLTFLFCIMYKLHNSYFVFFCIFVIFVIWASFFCILYILYIFIFYMFCIFLYSQAQTSRPDHADPTIQTQTWEPDLQIQISDSDGFGVFGRFARSFPSGRRRLQLRMWRSCWWIWVCWGVLFNWMFMAARYRLII